jgi:Icc-related predicted phosphoesterase
MDIWHIGDTHSYHNLLEIPENIDLVIHSGDFSNYYELYTNEIETRDFLNWYACLPIKHKVLIAGNHDAVPFHRSREFKKLCKEYSIDYLENESVIIEGIKIWGSPHTPQFGNWYFMKNRSKLDKVWQQIPENTRIVIVHGPPKGVLDLSYNTNHSVEMCGCSALKKRMLKIQPDLCLFGHVHNNVDIINAGTTKLSEYKTIFSNGSVLTDGKFGKLSSNGNILKIE